MAERYAPDDPREWLNRARSNLVLARMQGASVYLEDLCFHAQQAVEKAVKALLIQRHVPFPYVPGTLAQKRFSLLEVRGTQRMQRTLHHSMDEVCLQPGP